MTAALDAFGELAKRHGILLSYRDGVGIEHGADPEVVAALLRALGVPLERADEAPAILRAERAAARRRRLEPVLVHRIGRRDALEVTVPASSDPERLWLSIEFEQGDVARQRLAAALSGGTASFQPDGERDEHLRLDPERVTGGPLPPGRHRVTLEGAGPPATALLLCAPDCPPAPRQLGLFMPLHAVRSDGDWGIGSYPDLGRLSRWATLRGCGLVGTLPLYPSFLDAPADPSPYLPVSRLAYNEVYVDPLALPEFAASPEAHELCSSPWFQDRLASARSSALVDYEEVARLKRMVLETLARVVHSGGLPERRRELEAFVGARPELEGYARFRARTDPDPGADRSAAAAYHRYCQWAACEQLRAAGRGAGRYADLPIGSHPGGFDPEWSPASFVPDVHGGAPPDAFFPGGQDWGFRPLHPERIREDGYAFLSAALRRAFEHADCLRIDHVMGLQRLFMIPEGSREGAYVSYRADEMHALVALEAHRAGTVVVGEDLGTVPEEVRPRMERDGMLRTWVFQFETTGQQPLPSPPPHSLAALDTHDLPRFGTYLWGDDISERQARGLLSAAEAATETERRNAWRRRLFERLGLSDGGGNDEKLTAAALEGCLLHLAGGPTAILMADLEELWDERAPQNVPGTGPGGANWRRRSARTLEQIEGDPGLSELVGDLATGRCT
ncbi:MAG TPA: 4-alpha-glucanotransferase [Acidimicrobiales bacterium]|nr:4-alpha-glucanotransferase [Acidimicrobiales bacterium]